MKTFTAEELKEVLKLHTLWLEDNNLGKRANLRSADLSYANLRSADLSHANLSFADLSHAKLSFADLTSANLHSADLSFADLTSADLSSADLRFADLSSADLSSANLSFADLSSANLRFADLTSANLSSADLRFADLASADMRLIKEDFISKLLILKLEVPGLYKAVIDGKIDGSSYESECACFVGTIANNMGVNKNETGITLDPDSPTERFFLAINEGDTPDNNSISMVIKEWLEEFMNKELIKIPSRTVVWD